MARRQKKDALETRERLLESALDIMSEKPFANVTLTEIAERIGLSKGAIYWHFKNKDDVLVSLIENVCGQLEETLSSNLEHLESIDDMRGYFKEKIAGLLQSETSLKVNRLIHRREEWPEEIREKVMSILLDRMEKERETLEKLLLASQKGGAIRKDVSPRKLALLIGTVFQGIFICQIEGFFKEDSAEFIDFIFDAFKKELDPTNKTGMTL